ATILAIDHNILCTRFRQIVYKKRRIVKKMFRCGFNPQITPVKYVLMQFNGAAGGLPLIN
ncbi:MAG: hypothetical protein KAU41_06950, partial [Deltaproteobacteria bacterium]|nr:hypothetical protein [Deltaproteobacteria bacterium]